MCDEVARFTASMHESAEILTDRVPPTNFTGLAVLRVTGYAGEYEFFLCGAFQY